MAYLWLIGSSWTWSLSWTNRFFLWNLILNYENIVQWFSPEVIFAPWGHWQCLETFWLSHWGRGRLLLASSGQRNALKRWKDEFSRNAPTKQCTGKPPTKELSGLSGSAKLRNPALVWAPEQTSCNRHHVARAASHQLPCTSGGSKNNQPVETENNEEVIQGGVSLEMVFQFLIPAPSGDLNTSLLLYTPNKFCLYVWDCLTLFVTWNLSSLN